MKAHYRIASRHRHLIHAPAFISTPARPLKTVATASLSISLLQGHPKRKEKAFWQNR